MVLRIAFEVVRTPNMPHSGVVAIVFIAGAMPALFLQPAPARALDEQKGELAAIKACDQRLCTIQMQKNPKGDDLRCSLTKTWTLP